LHSSWPSCHLTAIPVSPWSAVSKITLLTPCHVMVIKQRILVGNGCIYSNLQLLAGINDHPCLATWLL
jgi:hypothetical protein